jgi:hypothetical protein
MENWIKEHHVPSYCRGTSRFRACILVDEVHLDADFEGRSSIEQFDVSCDGNVTLILRDGEEDLIFTKLTYLVPRIYS